MLFLVTGSTGTLSLECPSLEVVLRSMEARHAAGWFSPHMTAMLELQAAIGGRDALLVALNNARQVLIFIFKSHIIIFNFY